jgi:uncharacterized protein (TIGR02453 family)
MNPITAEFNQFFIDLAPNNHKDWFDENRKRYETHIKKPFEQFVALLIAEVNKHNKKINPKPKDCIFRINRDIRFAKDKTPYKMNRSAAINIGGRKDMSPDGVYVEMGPEHVRVYRGLFMLNTEETGKVRNYIAKNQKAFKDLYSDKNFKKYFGEIKGEQSKRMPKELKEAAEKENLIFNKQWYFYSQMTPEKTSDVNLIKLINERYLAGEPLAQFFKKALH